MIPRAVCWILFGAVFAADPLDAQPIIWSSSPGAVNLTSADATMDGGFRFELGVFEGAFVPNTENKELWAQHWRPAQRTGYNVGAKNFSSECLVQDNDAPFSNGKAAYVWGFKGDALSGEWILFRDSTWTWPAPVDPDSFPPPFPLYWTADEAIAILGEINVSGSPFLMKSAAVANAAPPATSWDQWRQEFLTNEALDGPNDDPDEDGMTNLLEFAFGTVPTAANSPVATPVTLQDGHAVITIPRRIDHLAHHVVQVSGDLLDWKSGPAHTGILQDDAAALVVRDLTPLSPEHPKRFMRFMVTLP